MGTKKKLKECQIQLGDVKEKLEAEQESHEETKDHHEELKQECEELRLKQENHVSTRKELKEMTAKKLAQHKYNLNLLEDIHGCSSQNELKDLVKDQVNRLQSQLDHYNGKPKKSR